MFRSKLYLEETKYVQIILPLKTGYEFTVRARDNFYDWYNAYFRVDFKFEAKANGDNFVADTESAPINGSFSLIKSLKVISSGKKLYEASDNSQRYFHQKSA